MVMSTVAITSPSVWIGIGEDRDRGADQQHRPQPHGGEGGAIDGERAQRHEQPDEREQQAEQAGKISRAHAHGRAGRIVPCHPQRAARDRQKEQPGGEVLRIADADAHLATE